MKKRWLILALTVLFLWLVVSRFAQLEQLKTTLAKAQWTWMLVAVLCQVVYYVAFAATYQAAFSTVNIQSRTRELIPVTLGSLFVNMVVPAGGAGGAMLFAEDLSRRGRPAAGVAAGVLLQLIADFSAFTLLLIPGMLYLFSVHNLKAYEIVAALLLLLMTTGLTGILLLGIWKPQWLNRLFSWSQRTASWLFGRLHRSLTLAEDWAQKNAQDFNLAAAAAGSHPLRLLRTVGTALLAHLLNLLTLYILFLAFQQPTSLGVLIAGYAVGILFWIVSITPQGIGVVEGMMALTFTSLGVPGAAAATIALAFRGLTFWLPMLMGFVAVQRLHTVSSQQRSLTEIWGVRFAAVMVALMGLINILSALTPSLASRLAVLERFSPLAVRHGGRLTAALSGFALLLLAHSLSRRKHVAWLLTLWVLGISALSHLVKGLDYEEALLAVGLIILLWYMRPNFHARSDPPSIRQGLQVLGVATLFTLAYGVAGFFLLDRHFSVNFGFWAALRQTVVMFTQFYDPGLVPMTHFGRFFASSIYTVAAVTFGYAGFMLLRPVFVRYPSTPAERTRAQNIVQQYGRSSLARFLLFDDKRYFFSTGGSLIGYILIGRVAVTLGDPVGPQEDLLPAIQAFTAVCQDNDWLTVFYQTLPETLELYRQAGFDSIPVGEEGIVNLETFTLEGKAGKPLRSPVNKLINAGYTFTMHQPPITDELLDELREVSDEWLTMMHGQEKGFSLGWFSDEYIRSSPIAVVTTPAGWISAYANLVPEYQRNEVAVDLMRRRKEIENGTMEFLFVSLFQWARAQGYQSFNLGLSSLSGVGEQSDDPARERVMHFIYEHINQFYNFKGLHAFKEKFQPEWSPRYLIYPGSMHLAESWLAVVRANSGHRA
ncbi:MAG: flippase-like domain-containing protein [Anaerolineales bacterium]